jgi:hypothetical protein
MRDLVDGAVDLYGVEVDNLAATSIAGRMADGLRQTSKLRPAPRIRPEFWDYSESE